MKAIVIHRGHDGPRLVWEEVADPIKGPQEALIEVRAAAVNRADLAQARGAYDPPPGTTDILGLEMAGEIAETGESASGWHPGDRVFALLPGGGYAERVAVHQDMLIRLPQKWSFAEGAAIPEVWYTAYLNLFLEGGLSSGESVLIHAGGSGVGTAAVQLAREAGARIFVTAGTPAKLEACRQLGSELAINYKEQEFLPIVLQATGGQGVDLILDPVGGPYLSDNIKALSPLGRLVSIGLLGGAKAELDMGQILGKRLRLIGSRLRSRPLREKIELTRKFLTYVWPKFMVGTFKPVIDKEFSLEEAEAAHAYVREDRNIGKVVLLRSI